MNVRLVHHREVAVEVAGAVALRRVPGQLGIEELVARGLPLREPGLTARRRGCTHLSYQILHSL